MTVAQPSTHRLRQRVSSRGAVNVYDALEGQFLSHRPDRPVELVVGEVVALKPLRRETQVHTALRKAVEARQKVTSEAAIARHNDALSRLGLPIPLHTVTIDTTVLVHLPVYVGLLRREDDRVIAINGLTGTVSEQLSHLLTGQLAHIRSSFAQ